VKLTNEAVEAAAKAVSLDWQNFVPSMRLALEAALPHLEGAAPVADKQVIAAALKDHEFMVRGGPGAEVFGCRCGVEFDEPGDDGYWEDPLRLHFADVLSAGGVFREGATPAIDRETLAAAAHKHYCVTPNEPTHEPDEIDYDKADEILEILALIGGAS